MNSVSLYLINSFWNSISILYQFEFERIIAHFIISILSSITFPSDNNSTGTVPLDEILYNSLGLDLNKISLNSILIFDFEIANLARIAYGQRRNEYNIGKISVANLANFIVLDKGLEIKEIYLNGQLVDKI